MSSLHPTSVVYPGSAGSYTSEAADRLYPTVEATSAGSFADVHAAVADESADIGMLPIENTLAGIVADTCDLITDGENGFTYEPDDVVSLASAVQRCLAPGAAGMGERARQLTEQCYSIHAVAGQYEALYARLLPGRCNTLPLLMVCSAFT